MAVARKVKAEDIEQRAERIKANVLIIDALSGHIVSPEPPPKDGKSHLDRVIDAGLNVVNITLAARSETLDDLFHQAYQYLNLISARPKHVTLIETVDDIARCHREGRLGIIFGSQTGDMVGRDISRWTILHKLGLRISQLTYNERNELGDGCMEPENRGLTAFGRQAVQEMNRLGIIVDLSHVGERTALDATLYSSKPVIYSHSNPRALVASRRNATDDQMRLMAETGGVMGISPFSPMCAPTPGVRPTLEDYLDMVDYAVKKIGIDHVGIGSDVYESHTKLAWESSTKRQYPNPWWYETKEADGFSTVSDWPQVIRGLIGRGYSDPEIEKILGQNWLRVFTECWTGPDGGDVPATDRGWRLRDGYAAEKATA
jgi:membrane dipeptidase